MALNLSTLTSPATSGDVLAEALTTTADFLENVPVLRNLARGSQKGGDAKQDVALNQPRSLPLIKNPQGNLGGYLYIPNVSGNYATGPSVTIGSNQTWEAEVDMVITQFEDHIIPFGAGPWNAPSSSTTPGFGLFFANNANVYVFSKAVYGSALSGVVLGQPFTVKYGFDGTNVFCDINAVRKVTQTATGQSGSITHPLQIAQQAGITHAGNYAIQKAKLTVNNAVVFDCDFNGSTSIRHGDQKFKAAVGGFVSIASPELITNGNFDTDTAWVKTGGWSIADGVATLASVSGSSDLISTVIPVTAGKTYKVVVNVIATSGSFRLYDTGGVVAYSLNVGENVFSRVATGSSYHLVPLSIGSGTATIDSISVTEVSPDAKRDPITVVKKDILRFDGANDFMNGVLNQTVTGGYMFASFSVLGDGGESFARVLSVNPTGVYDSHVNSAILSIREGVSDLSSFMGASAFQLSHSGLFDDANGDILHETKITNGNQRSLVNNANLQTQTLGQSILSQEFNLAAGPDGNNNAAIDLEFLALFSADSVPDEATAKRIRDYINGRGSHPIFSLIDSAGYYFYNAQKAPVGAISSGSSAWNGRIVGSDNGDADKYATQSTANDSPVGNGYTVTFADNTDHLDIPSTTQAGWQIVGTSLGTFTYRVDNDAVTELNLLGNLGNASFRKAGDLYGIILLPESATGADIEAARKLLTDRGASDGATSGSYFAAWYARGDMVEFGSVDLSAATSFDSAWGSNSLVKFSPTDISNCTNFSFAWSNCTSLNDFAPIQAPLGSNFSSAWKSCSALTSFPAGAKLGTEATNVNFSSAFFGCASLESLPAGLDLSQGNRFYLAFYGCTALTTVGNGVLLGTASSGVDFTQAFLNCVNLVTLPANLNLSKGDDFQSAFENCSSLVTFPSGAFDNMGTPLDYCFTNAWASTSALSATSVENILVSINTSGQSAPSTGPEITIKYNTATGTPAYSTLASLKSKGWVIKVNNVTL